MQQREDFLYGRLKILRSLNEIEGFPSWVIEIEEGESSVIHGRLFWMKRLEKYLVQFESGAERILQKQEINFIHDVRRELTKRYSAQLIYSI